MLARTADNLYWLARYVERADHVARIIEATSRLAALPRAYGGASNEWESALVSTGGLKRFTEDDARVPDESSVLSFLVFEIENPSSIHNCVEAARRNARAVRTALTVETWEAINSAWLEMTKFERARTAGKRLDRDELNRFLALVKKMALDVDGSAYRTMLRNDAFYFMRLGHFVERADNTARLLDVKYQLLLPEAEQVGGSLDYFQWTAILRAVSANTAYHWVYRQAVKPWLVADLLILKPDMPRSLIACYENIVRWLDLLARQYGRQGASQRHARAMLAKLQGADLKAIFQSGLHEFVEGFTDDNDRMGSVLAEQYLVH
ncbi:MAG: alpha-E domain-containing protein [Hyphomicrobiales bacterium]|nr:alpha-E domain-containing protein [Hyphomicrobiales bacterium]